MLGLGLGVELKEREARATGQLTIQSFYGAIAVSSVA
jgi:hypothetical protein